MIWICIIYVMGSVCGEGIAVCRTERGIKGQDRSGGWRGLGWASLRHGGMDWQTLWVPLHFPRSVFVGYPSVCRNFGGSLQNQECCFGVRYRWIPSDLPGLEAIPSQAGAGCVQLLQGSWHRGWALLWKIRAQAQESFPPCCSKEKCFSIWEERQKSKDVP